MSIHESVFGTLSSTLVWPSWNSFLFLIFCLLCSTIDLLTFSHSFLELLLPRWRVWLQNGELAGFHFLFICSVQFGGGGFMEAPLLPCGNPCGPLEDIWAGTPEDHVFCDHFLFCNNLLQHLSESHFSFWVHWRNVCWPLPHSAASKQTRDLAPKAKVLRYHHCRAP